MSRQPGVHGLARVPAAGHPDATATVVSDVESAAGARWSRSIVVQLVVVEAALFVAGLSFLWFLHDRHPVHGARLELVLAGALGTFSLSALLVAVAAGPKTRPPGAPGRPLPATTAIIPAYLPNEADILAETIRAHLAHGPAEGEVLVAYNTPEPLAVEAELATMAAEEPRLTVVRVAASNSKADNINAVIGRARGEVVGIFDADHHPEPGGFEQAWRWLDAGYAVVQGRCVVRGAGSSWGQRAMHSMVGTEFETMYAVGHPGRTRLHGFGIFGGSNGYWRRDVLARTGFDAGALTEDIDASVRVLRAGGRIASDPGIVSTEFAPPSLRALCSQRLRWAQGWFQVSRRHVRALVTCPSSTLRQRLGAGWMFGAGVVLPWLAAFTLPFMVFKLLADPVSPWASYVRFFVTLGTVAFVAHTAVAYRLAVAQARRPGAFVVYVVANLVFYAHLRVALNRLGHLHELWGRTEWRVTPRR